MCQKARQRPMLPEPPKKHPGGGIEESEETAVNETAEGEPKYGGTLRFGYGNSIATPGYTPMATANAYLYYLTLAYENLITYDNDGQIIGKLATEWVIDNDEPSITWTLREGVEFADGTPFNAEAVKVNIEEYQANNRTETANVKSCEVIDDTHIKMILESVNSSTLESVGYFVFYMSPDVLRNDRASLDTSTCGTGPFQLTEFENNAYAIYSKNENYWQEGLPYLDSVSITTVTEETTKSTAFQAGEYDMIDASSPTILQELDGAGIYLTEKNENGMGVGTLGLIPNSAIDSPWADERVRRALCYAIDVDAINAAFQLGTAQLTDQWAAPGAVTYNDDLNHFKYDPERAKELLAEAGYADGFTTNLVTISTLSDAFTAIANMLEEVGIHCEIQLVDGSTQNQMYMDGTWEGLMPHWTTVSPDLGLYMGRHLDYDGAYYAKGIQHPDKEMNLLEEIRTCTDETERRNLEKELQKAIYDAEEGSCLFGRPLYISPSIMYKYDYVMNDRAKEAFASAWDLSGCWLDK
ncbi:MAG: ABC transporter substrate-binding protein [Lachnospiraceae bacterium]|nr:ABC transporter substrate-binding protein [Lachnospiraceae bacterium]